MPVTSASEFEAISSQIIIRIDKVLYERGEEPKLKDARRDLAYIQSVARDNSKLKSLQPKLMAVGEVLRVEIPKDDALGEMLWDLVDYIDYQI